MKSKAIIISQESKRLRSNSCHSEESRFFRDDEESKKQILRSAQNDNAAFSDSRCRRVALVAGTRMEKLTKDGMRIK